MKLNLKQNALVLYGLKEILDPEVFEMIRISLGEANPDRHLMTAMAGTIEQKNREIKNLKAELETIIDEESSAS